MECFWQNAVPSQLKMFCQSGPMRRWKTNIAETRRVEWLLFINRSLMTIGFPKAPAMEPKIRPFPSMRAIFGPGGLLERCMIGGYEHRPAQLEMAEAVHDAFAKHHHAIVEAGTGTGKTLAYFFRRSAAVGEW